MLTHSFGECVGVREGSQDVFLIRLDISLVHLGDLIVDVVPGDRNYSFLQFFFNDTLFVSYRITSTNVAHSYELVACFGKLQ